MGGHIEVRLNSDRPQSYSLLCDQFLTLHVGCILLLGALALAAGDDECKASQCCDSGWGRTKRSRQRGRNVKGRHSPNECSRESLTVLAFLHLGNFYEPDIVTKDQPDDKLLVIAALRLPKVYQKNGRLQTVDADAQAFYQNELDVGRLNAIHHHLWLAGIKRPARPLTEQKVLKRSIVVTEQPDLHLLWSGGVIYIKPLPDFLLCRSVWEDTLCCESSLYEQALGFLLSYVWLISRRNDLSIAHEIGLLPSEVTWEVWTDILGSLASKVDLSRNNDINMRYQFSELRLSRVNWIYRLSAQTFNFTNLLRGYKYGYYNYGEFLEQNLKWLVTLSVYVAIVLSAMQVGLATKRLENNQSFHNASYGFAVFAILSPVIAIVATLALVGVLILFNLRYTLRRTKQSM
ncbi:MAG: hypothetical protein Q9162_003855 [Coniocarpon cinnabarinum]